MSTFCGYSAQHDPQVQDYQRQKATVLAAQQQRRQVFRKELGLPEPTEDNRSLLRRALGRPSKQDEWLDSLLVKKMAHDEWDCDSHSGSETDVEDNCSEVKVQRQKVLVVKQ